MQAEFIANCIAKKSSINYFLFNEKTVERVNKCKSIYENMQEFKLN